MELSKAGKLEYITPKIDVRCIVPRQVIAQSGGNEPYTENNPIDW